MSQHICWFKKNPPSRLPFNLCVNSTSGWSNCHWGRDEVDSGCDNMKIKNLWKCTNNLRHDGVDKNGFGPSWTMLQTQCTFLLLQNSRVICFIGHASKDAVIGNLFYHYSLNNRKAGNDVHFVVWFTLQQNSYHVLR